MEGSSLCRSRFLWWRHKIRSNTKVPIHCLRHSFVSALALVDGSKAVAKELAGHSSELVSDNYTHLPAETLTAAVEKLPDITEGK